MFAVFRLLHNLEVVNSGESDNQLITKIWLWLVWRGLVLTLLESVPLIRRTEWFNLSLRVGMLCMTICLCLGLSVRSLTQLFKKRWYSSQILNSIYLWICYSVLIWHTFLRYIDRIATAKWELKDLGMEHNGYTFNDWLMYSNWLCDLCLISSHLVSKIYNSC